MSDTSDEQKVIIYSTSWCGFCKMAKQYFDSKKVAYEDKNVEEDAEAYKELMKKVDGNFQGVPVIDIKGQIVLGFDRQKIDAALAA